VVKALCYKQEDRGLETRRGEFFNLPLFLVTLGPGVYTASNRNEYQKQKNNLFLGNKVRLVRRADKLTAICDPIF
jgi:hypothetical protein